MLPNETDSMQFYKAYSLVI